MRNGNLQLASDITSDNTILSNEPKIIMAGRNCSIMVQINDGTLITCNVFNCEQEYECKKIKKHLLRSYGNFSANEEGILPLTNQKFKRELFILQASLIIFSALSIMLLILIIQRCREEKINRKILRINRKISMYTTENDIPFIMRNSV